MKLYLIPSPWMETITKNAADSTLSINLEGETSPVSIVRNRHLNFYLAAETSSGVSFIRTLIRYRPEPVLRLSRCNHDLTSAELEELKKMDNRFGQLQEAWNRRDPDEMGIWDYIVQAKENGVFKAGKYTEIEKSSTLYLDAANVWSKDGELAVKYLGEAKLKRTGPRYIEGTAECGMKIDLHHKKETMIERMCRLLEIPIQPASAGQL